MIDLTAERPAPSADALAFIAASHRPFIDGVFSDAKSSEVIDVENPAREEIIAQVQASGPEDVERAVAAARRAFPGWSKTPPKERARILLKFADLLEARADLLAEVETLEAGIPLALSVPTLRNFGGEVIRYYAGWATKLEGSSFPAIANGREEYELMVYTVRDPIGVVAAIVPWNAPASMILMKLGPAMATGCTMVLKSAELSPMVAEMLAITWRDAGGPPGTFNVIHGIGRTTGAALVSHKGVDKITFTGSTAVGKEIVRAASHDLRRVTLELGGKSPFVVFPDAPMDEAVPAAALACFFLSGQNCMAGSRLFLHQSIKDEFLERLAAFSATLKVGDGLSPDTLIGPLISAAHKAKVQGFIDTAVAEGGRVVYSGGQVKGPGHFVTPTIIDGIIPQMQLARDEVFGPVLAVLSFDDDEEALAAAVGETTYGLSGSVWTQDLRRAHRFARRIDSGQVSVNIHAAISPETPFGGNRQSGWGREFGRESLDAYLKTKAISVNVGLR